MKGQIVLNSSQELTDVDADTQLSKKLAGAGFSINDTVDEMSALMVDAKSNWWAEALKVRFELIKHAQALHWSRASKSNINIWIFTHPDAWAKLNY